MLLTERRCVNNAYCGKILMLLKGFQPVLSPVPTGLLEDGKSGLLAKGPGLLPQSLQSLRADWDPGHPGARQGTCNQHNWHTIRHAYSKTHAGLVIGPCEHPPPSAPFQTSSFFFCLILFYFPPWPSSVFLKSVILTQLVWPPLLHNNYSFMCEKSPRKGHGSRQTVCVPVYTSIWPGWVREAFWCPAGSSQVKGKFWSSVVHM